MFTDVLVWRSVSSQGKKKNTACDSPKKKNPEKCFSSSPRSCWLTGGYSIHQRSAQQSPSFSCEGGRRCARQASSTEGGHHFRFARGLFYFASRAEIAIVAALILKKKFLNNLTTSCRVQVVSWRAWSGNQRRPVEVLPSTVRLRFTDENMAVILFIYWIVYIWFGCVLQ